MARIERELGQSLLKLHNGGRMTVPAMYQAVRQAAREAVDVLDEDDIDERARRLVQHLLPFVLRRHQGAALARAIKGHVATLTTVDRFENGGGI